MRWIKENRVTLIIAAVGLFGLGLILYPSVADWWNSFHQSRAVAAYAQKVANMDASAYEKILADAEAYNNNLASKGIKWTMNEDEIAAYEKELDITGTGIMGYITIPKIHVELPVYHGIDDAVLQIAIGHMPETSLPVGGESTHCAVSGHRGLPSAKLFTDIDKLVEGDTWTVSVLNRTLTYEVDQIRVVEPSDLSNLKLEQGKDYFTLITCTPYGINTHRLLVRGHRVDNAQGEANVIADALQIEPVYIAPFVALPFIFILLIVMLVSTEYNRRRTKIRSHVTSTCSKTTPRRWPPSLKRRPRQIAPISEICAIRPLPS